MRLFHAPERLRRVETGFKGSLPLVSTAVRLRWAEFRVQLEEANR